MIEEHFTSLLGPLLARIQFLYAPHSVDHAELNEGGGFKKGFVNDGGRKPLLR
jgi:hypothetical protein